MDMGLNQRKYKKSHIPNELGFSMDKIISGKIPPISTKNYDKKIDDKLCNSR